MFNFAAHSASEESATNVYAEVKLEAEYEEVEGGSLRKEGKKRR